MRIIMAPMEGLADVHLRKLLTHVGGMDWCVSEFVRVSGQLLPEHLYLRYCPELQEDAQVNGVPVHVQLLGSDPVCLAENAHRAAELGAPAIDLNFGCPARTVNKHCGGAVLLDDPERIFNIVKSVRAAVPEGIPVSAKMRLGNKDRSLAMDNATAIEAAGASWLTVHARTRVDGYKPPAYWSELRPISEALAINVIANGEIWNTTDYQRCLQESGCSDVMIGRGLVSLPNLARCLRGQAQPLSWPESFSLLQMYLDLLRETGTPLQLSGRVKQWLGFLSKTYQEAQVLFDVIKREKEFASIELAITRFGCETGLIAE